MESLKCKSCLLEYDPKKRIPVCLPCGHTCCEPCYRKNTKVDPQGNSISCPFDKRTFEASLENLPINQDLNEML